MKLNKQAILQALPLLGILAVLAVILQAGYNDEIYTTPDEIVIVASLRQLRDHGNINLDNGLNDRYGICAFTPHVASFRSTNELYAHTFPGTIVLLYPLFLLLGDKAIFVFSALSMFLLVIAVYLITRAVGGSNSAGLIVAAAIATSPLIVHWSLSGVNNIPMTLFLMLSVLALVKDKRVLAGALFGMSFLVREDTFLLLPAFIAYLFLKKKPWLDFLVPTVLSLVLLLGLHAFFYGDPFYSPYTSSSHDPCSELSDTGLARTASSIPRYLFRLGETDAGGLVSYWLLHVNSLVDNVSIYPVALVGLFCFSLVWRRNLPFVALVMLVFIILFLFHGNRESYFGFGDIRLNSSFHRYLVPAFALLTIGLGLALDSLIPNPRWRQFAAAMLILAVVAVQLPVLYEYFHGINSLHSLRDSFQDDSRAVLKMTATDDVVLISVRSVSEMYLERPNSAVLYYLDNKPQAIRLVSSALNDSKRVFLAVDSQSSQKDKQISAELIGQFRGEQVASNQRGSVIVYRLRPVSGG